MQKSPSLLNRARYSHEALDAVSKAYLPNLDRWWKTIEPFTSKTSAHEQLVARLSDTPLTRVASVKTASYRVWTTRPRYFWNKYQRRRSEKTCNYDEGPNLVIPNMAASRLTGRQIDFLG